MTQKTTICPAPTCRDSQPKYGGIVPRNKAELTLMPTYRMQLTVKNKTRTLTITEDQKT